nr:reverse transcriptase domain-containing protein [Tanacetum cinerariifolium]
MANSGGSSFMNVDNSISGTTLIIDKIRKFEKLLTSGQAILVDKAGNPLKKVKFLGKYNSEDEVASVDNDMARSLASERISTSVEDKELCGSSSLDDVKMDDDQTKDQAKRTRMVWTADLHFQFVDAMKHLGIKIFSRNKYAEEDRVTFITGTLTNDALSWWNAYTQPIGIKQANKITWTKLKRLLTNNYCPRTEIKKMEDEFYNLVIKENELKTYIRRFQELALLCSNMVQNSKKLMEVFIEGLPRSIKGNVTALKPQTLEEVITITQRLMEQVIKQKSTQEADDHKRKFEDRRNTIGNNDNNSNNHNNNNFQDNRDNNNHNHNYHHQQNKSQEAIRAYAVNPTKKSWYARNLPLCRRCRLHHTGSCSVACQVCNKVGHQTKYYKNKRPATRNNLQPVSITCNVYGEKGHYVN